MYLGLLTSALNVDEIDIMSGGVDGSPKSHGICNLPVEPDALIYRNDSTQNRTQDTETVAKHWEKDEATVICQDESSSSRSPDRELE